MATERDPYARVYDVEDDDFTDRFADEDLFQRDEFGFEEFGCCCPERCCMPGPHSRSECVSVEMMEDLSAEAYAQTQAAGELDHVDRPAPDPEGDPS